MALQPVLRKGARFLKSPIINCTQSASISLVAKEEVHRFISDAMKAVGTPENHASTVANVLLEADYRGHHSHGLGRLDVYVSDVSSGSCDSKATPKILKESVATVWADGQGGLGPVIGEHCMNMAINKAADSGIAYVAVKGSPRLGNAVTWMRGVLPIFGLAGGPGKSYLTPAGIPFWVQHDSLLSSYSDNIGVSLRGLKTFRLRATSSENRATEARATSSNHFGIAAWYSMMALEKGMLGMSFTNTSPIMSPTRSKEAALGTNPLSLAAPAGPTDSVLLDMATTAAALGKIEVKRRLNLPIPPGWAQGPDGKPTTDAHLAYKTSCLQPLGGLESTAGYKGYGLSLMVDILTGVLAGASYGPKIRRWGQSHEVANIGHGFLAINPEFFAPGFRERMADLNLRLRSMEPAEVGKPILVPGDPERAEMERVDKEGGIRYPATYIQKLASFAETVHVKPMDIIWTK